MPPSREADVATPQPTLATPRLVLRAFALEDAPAVTAHLGTPEIAANTARIPFPYEQHMAETWIASHGRDWDEQREVTFAVTLAGTGTLIGAVGLVLDLANRQAELGYWLGKPYWGRGYASEAARRIVGWGFDELDLNRIHAGYLTHNPASGQVLTKLGMQHEGLRREHLIKNGQPVDVVVTGLLRRDWRP